MVFIATTIIAVSTEVSLIFIELGVTVIILALLARLTSRWGFSALLLYLEAGLGVNAGIEPRLDPLSAAYVLFLAILGPFLTRAVASRQGKILKPGEV